ncbi:MAG: mannonate dehydratase [Fastidiosipilaceae bacterium]|jgi:mannonate dehydratase|nr:mannonate dehydratase [Clostridiaceae bacterium]
MKMTFRWYGEGNDSVPLKYIRQIPNCSGIMGVLDQYAAGEVWPEEVIADYVKHVNSAGLEVEVIESVNVHEDIKLGLDTRDQYIENYNQTIRNLAKHGIKVIVYNFMPVFDWLRTDLNREIEEDGSTSLYYDEKELQGMTPQELVAKTAETSGGFTLPGWEPDRLAELDKVLKQYESVDAEQLLKNYKYFLEGIIPTCEEVGIRMAVHPDDPAWPIFGIPRIAHSQEQFDRIIELVDSPANSLCLCTGSLGSSPANDIPNIIRHFAAKDRIACAHVRNVKYLGERRFREASHLSADGDLDMFEIMLALYENDFQGYIRPDHGRMIWDEQARAGYGLYDRALGIAYLNGIWESLQKMKPRQ